MRNALKKEGREASTKTLIPTSANPAPRQTVDREREREMEGKTGRERETFVDLKVRGSCHHFVRQPKSVEALRGQAAQVWIKVFCCVKVYGSSYVGLWGLERLRGFKV